MKASISMPEGWGDTRAAADIRDALAQTRTLLPAVGHWLAVYLTRWAALPVVAISAIVHVINLSGYPYYHTDEGTYIAQAWAILRLSELAHYTYWYDHAPFGWIQVAAWTVLSQGFYTFGTPIDGGRVLMLVMHCWSTYLVFQIARTISRSVLTATLAGLLFGLSAYGVYYHRRVLLDNITTPWMLLSILMIVRSPLALTRAWMSAVALGISILSKELTIFLVPVLATVICARADRAQRLFATLSWLFIVLAIVSTYPLMAALKGELFPFGTLLGGGADHVSLIGSLLYQAARGRDDGLLSLASSFWRETAGWAAIEPLLAIGGSLGAVAGALLFRRFPLYGTISLATLALFAFLARGGIILGFYYVPLLPLLALNVALPAGWLAQWLPTSLARRWSHLRSVHLVAWSSRAISWSLALLCLLPLLHGYQSGALGLDRNPLGLWTTTQTVGQREAIDWIRRHVHPESMLLVDDEAWVALREPRSGQPVFNNAHWYFKIDGDPEIRLDVFRNDPRNVDYILNTQDVYDRSREADVPLARAAIDASTPIASFEAGRYPVEIRRVHRLNRWRASQDPMLARSWADFKAAYIQRGRVVELAAGGVTTSEAQALAMLRSVYMDDRVAFDELWTWARSRLQVRADGLMVRRYGPDPTGGDTVLDRATATAADQDAALALLFAARQWRQLRYQQQALKILDGIWRLETASVAGTRVVVAGDWARNATGDAIVSPAAFAPYAYRIFSAADPRHPWETLVDSSYQLAAQIQMNPAFGSEAGAIPNLVAFELKTGASRSASQISPHADELSGDAGRMASRFAVDLIWNGEHRAQDVLDRLSLPRRTIASTGWLAAAYDLNGQPTIQQESMAMYAGVLPSLMFQGNDDMAHLIFADKIVRPIFDHAVGAHGQASSVDDLGWAWFATAFMHGGLGNLWDGETTIDWPTVLARMDTSPTPDRPGIPPGALNAALAAGSARSAIVAPDQARGRPASEAALAAPGFAPTPSASETLPTAPLPAARLAAVSRPAPAVQAPSAVVPPVSRPPDPPAAAPSSASPRVVVHSAVVPVFRPTAPLADLSVHVVQPGDSLLDIAERHGTDVEALIALNRLQNPDVIVVGTSLKVPALTASQASESAEEHP